MLDERTDGQTERHDETNKLIVTFCNFAKSSKMPTLFNNIFTV
jgi:hypothetical protein